MRASRGRGDPAIQTFRDTATYLLGLKTWIYTPQGGTLHELNAVLSSSLCSALEGRWHDLPRASRSDLVPRVVVRSVISAVLPLTILVGTRVFIGEGSIPMEGWLFVATGLWLVVKVLHLLEGLRSTSFEAFRTIAEALKPPR